MNIKPIKKKLSVSPIKKVCAYARVSANNLDMHKSLLAQVDYYCKLISSRPDWELVDIFVDKGLSGTKVDRPEFNRMLEMARNGEIDLILTKSISRFARNLVVLLSTMQELRNLGVDVFFEEENIHGLDRDCELILSLLAMMAEEEAKNYSELAKLSLKSRYRNGDYLHVHTYGYRVINGNQYEIVDEEAEVVRRIFDEFISGKPVRAIARGLNRDGLYKSNTRGMLGAKRKDAKHRLWRDNTVEVILKNEKYTGSTLLQKTYVPDFRTKNRKRNQGELAKYYVESEHPAIISVETFNQARLELERRKTLPKPVRHLDIKTLFRGVIFCEGCGSPYQRRLHQKGEKYRISYNCSRSINRYDNHCKMPRIRESVLIEKTKEVLGLPDDTELTRNIITSSISRIEVLPDEMLKFILKDGTTATLSCHYERSDSWPDDWKPLPNTSVTRKEDN